MNSTNADEWTHPQPLEVNEVVEILAGEPDDARVIDTLDRGAEALISSDLIHRLVPFAPRLRSIDFTGHPWAGMPAAVAVCALDRPLGRARLTAARRELEARSQRVGIGWACFLEGLEDLGEGNITRAEAFWERSHDLLGAESRVSTFSATNLCLAAYARGDLNRAAFLAERALSGARRAGDARIEGMAGIYLALFRWWIGDFAAVERAATEAIAAIGRTAEPLDRYDLPLAYAALGAVAYTRGLLDEGDAHLEQALALARSLNNEWHEAILRTVRGYLTAADEPRRSLDDATRALEYYGRVGEEWWSHWALDAFAAATRANGDLHASVVISRDLLTRVDNPLERGRTQLELATTLLELGERDEPRELLGDAIRALDGAGAQYLAARAELDLARAAPTRAAYVIRSAQGRAGRQATDPAWRNVLRGAPVRVQLLGNPVVEVAGRAIKFPTRYELEACAYLALAGPSGVNCERLRETLWPEVAADAGAHRLDVLLSRLRLALLPATRLHRSNGNIALDLDDDECDVRTLIAQCRRLLAGEAVDRVEVGAALEEPLLGGVPRDWVVEQQHELDCMRARIDTYVRP